MIEGTILPNVREREGPFGDFAGYYVSSEKSHVFEVRAITCRKNPIYQTILAGGTEDLSLYVSIEADVYRRLRRMGISVKDVRINSSPYHYVIRIKEPSEETSAMAIRQAFQSNPWIKM